MIAHQTPDPCEELTCKNGVWAITPKWLLFQMAQTKTEINSTIISTGLGEGVTNQGHQPEEVTCPEKPATSFIKGSSFHVPVGKEAEMTANFPGLF